ncbi:hypothetical protein VB713_25110 [Anabaena cylindrica UHCC 0172]|uniref:hypothetical protein n=1 Tax=Anabaena cylindrica TaxID=1165 RepID=UPI002B215E2A|nr:hypothetical protein [Anabaena cylindrica]MEA5554220.1 hypothetical protein [Anabaena cylindrica UHCC 0172]
MVQQMLKRLIQWLKKFFQPFFRNNQNFIPVTQDVQKEVAPPLSDTDLEFLFTELLAGVHQARGQAWAQNWLHKIEHRITTQRWLDWLKQFGEKLLTSRTPNNELAARLVQLGELDIGEIGDLAYDIGMQLLTRNQGEPIWEYDGPDTISQVTSESITYVVSTEADDGNFLEEDYQTLTWDELLVMLQDDQNLRQQIAQDLAIETDDPEIIIQTLLNQSQTSVE